MTAAALLLAMVLAQGPEQELQVRHPETGDPEGRNEFQVEVLKAVLESTRGSHGAFRMEAVADMPQAREIQSLVEGRWHDVLWTMTNARREQQMRPIRFPLLRGLLGHRICLIRRDDPLFQGAGPPERNQLVVGQGASWPDTPIFRSNGFTTEAGSDYNSTMRMLVAGRTNCFPRGLSELDIELVGVDGDTIGVDAHLSFLYFAPMYFFVAPQREALAERIETGLQHILDSGEFARIYARHFDPDELLTRYRMAERSHLCLENPDLSSEVLMAQRSQMVAGPGSYADECLGDSEAVDE